MRIPAALLPRLAAVRAGIRAMESNPGCSSLLSFSSVTAPPRPQGSNNGRLSPSIYSIRRPRQSGICSLTSVGCFSSEACSSNGQPTDDVQELYQKMLKSLESRARLPNAWVWSMINACSNKEDIKLLFQILQKFRIFRLSSLRIHSDFNPHLCMRVAEACSRAGALDYGLMTLRKHNVYGLTPTIASAHYLLRFAEEHNYVKLMQNIVRTLEKNSLQLQPSTANIIFSICSANGRWDLLTENAKRFMSAGVKLRRVAFGLWMEYAAKRGDSQSIWKINSLRSQTVKKHNLATWFACIKGYLLDGKPRRAANSIQLLFQNFPNKEQDVHGELQKLVTEWPSQVVKRRQKEEREVFATKLRSDMDIMLGSLSNKGINVAGKFNEPHFA